MLKELLKYIQSETLRTSKVLPDKAHAIPAGLEVHDLDIYYENPRRIAAERKALTVAGLTEYLRAYQEDRTVVHANPTTGCVKVIFDYHEPDTPHHGDHTITFTPTPSRKLQEWGTKDGRLMGQREFAEWIDEHAEDVVSPDSAKVLEIAQTMEATKTVDFKSATRLSGAQDVQISYTEETDTSAGERGHMVIPEVVTIGIPVFEGDDAYKIDARIRYRIDDGRLTIGYKLLRLEDVKEDAINLILEAIGTVAEEVSVPVYEVE